jgi:hypothetical protein
MPQNSDPTDETPPEPKLIEGKYAILAVLIIGLAGAIGGWWYRSQLQRRAIALWGLESAELMQHAPSVELLKLTPLSNDAERDAENRLSFGDARLGIAERIDVSQAPGLVHLRHSLISDQSFVWSAPLDACQPHWPYALRFAGDKRSATLLVDFDCRQALLAERNARASIEPMAQGLEVFVNEQLETSESPR